MMSVRRGGVLMLGPAHVVIDGVVHDLGSNRRAALLARLVIAGGRPLSAERLADEVWGVVGPTAEGTVRVTVARLRALLGARAILRTGRGYALDLDEIDVDVVHFDRLTATRSVTGAARLARLDEALALVRGSPFAGLEGYPFVDREMHRFTDRLRGVVDERLGLLVERGAGSDHIAEFEAAVLADPLNEHRCAALMTVLYRAGRQADALAVLRGLEGRLRDKVERWPAPALRQLERRILDHDPTLLAEGMSTVVAKETVVEIDAVVRSATSLARLGAFEPAMRFAQEGVDVARALDDEQLLGRSLVALARISDVAAETIPDADPSVADHALAEATAIARRAADGSLLAAVALARLGRGNTPRDDQLAWLVGPLELLPRSSAERLSLLCAASAALIDTDNGALATRLAEQIDRLADEADPLRRGALRAAMDCFIRADDPPLDELDQRSLEALELATRSGDVGLLTIALHARLIVTVLGGDLGEVGRLAPVIAQAGREALLPFAVQRARLLEQAVALADGQLDGLGERIDASAELGRRIGTAAVDAHHAQRVMLAVEQCDDGALDLLVGPPRWAGCSADDFLDVTRLLAEAERVGDAALHLRAQVGELVARLHERSAAPPPAVAAVLAEIAWWTRSASLAGIALTPLERCGARSVVLGADTLILGPAVISAGICHALLGDQQEAGRLLESGIERAARRGGALHAARGRVWLAAVRHQPATIPDGAVSTPRLQRLADHVTRAAPNTGMPAANAGSAEVAAGGGRREW